MLRIYGYAGCTTVKKARQWAETDGVEHEYAHFNKVPDLEARLRAWVADAGIDAVFNAKAQTLKKMDEAERQQVLSSDESRIAAMVSDPRLIKRPVGTDDRSTLTGFVEADWRAAFA